MGEGDAADRRCRRRRGSEDGDNGGGGGDNGRCRWSGHLSHNNHDDSNGGDGDASGTHPVTMVSWWDVVKWCNLKSLIEGRRPAYYTAATLNAGAVFKVGTPEVFVDWSAPSYRLPTEAEWEFSCRAGTTGPVYGELSQIAWFAENSGDGTHPAGQLLVNNWGLQDMMGNVWEWCWDWKPVYDGSPQIDPRGASSGTDRVMRGGCFQNVASICRAVAMRSAIRACANVVPTLPMARCRLRTEQPRQAATSVAELADVLVR